MTQRCNLQFLLQTLHSKVGVPLNTPNLDTTSWEELGVESLGLTEVCSSLEHVLAIAIPHEEALLTRNAQELVEFVNALPSDGKHGER